jgi:membrane protein DedA with SNARE-associated domain
VTSLAVGSITTLIDEHGQLALLFLAVIVGLESFGVPLPGETALIACAVLASQGSLSIAAVIAVAAAAAIIGDNLGYWVARKGGRPLLERNRFTRSYAERYLPRAERLFARHGGKAVFFGRFISVLRVAAAWVAGLSHMQWSRFLLWNAAGAICWATLVGLIVYYLGDSAANAIGKYGLYAAGGALVVAALGYVVLKRLERRVIE